MISGEYFCAKRMGEGGNVAAMHWRHCPRFPDAPGV